MPGIAALHALGADMRCRASRRTPLVAVAIGLLMVSATALASEPETARRALELLPRASGRAQTYINIRYALYFAGTVWYALALVWLIRSRAAVRVCRWTETRGFRPYQSVALVWLAVSTALALWMAVPAIAGYATERAYGFATYGISLWAADRARDWALGVLWVIVVVPAYWLIRVRSRTWWLWLSGLLFPLGVAMTLAYPVVIDPLYNRFRALEDPALRVRLLDLAARAGAGRPDLLVADKSRRTTKLNAYVTGVGPTKRIVLWDTTLQKLGHDEVVAITAHELGHYRLQHIWWGIGLQTVGGLAILGLMAILVPRSIARYGASVRTAADPAGLPVALAVLWVLLLVQTPLAAAVSRHMERAADQYGLELCRDGDATARSFAAFYSTGYADPDPPRLLVWWHHSHPPLRERVERALAYTPER